MELATSLPQVAWKEPARHICVTSGNNRNLSFCRLESEEKEGNFAQLKYCSAIRLTFKCSRHHVVEGAGISVAEFKVGDFEAKGKSINFARKHSKTTALQNAFAKVILITLDDKKVTIEVDSTKSDPFFFDPLWEKHEADVQEVEYEVPEESEVEENDVE